MSDNVGASGVTAPSGTRDFRTTDASGVHTPHSIIALLNGSTPTPIAPGQTTSAASVPVVMANDQTPVPTGSRTVRPSGSFTRPANTSAYASGQLVANSATAGSVTPISLTAARVNGGSGRVLAVKLHKSTASLTNAAFRVHLFGTSPTVTNGDLGTFLPNNVANYLGATTVVMDTAFSDGAAGRGLPDAGAVISFIAGAGVQTISALIEARQAYTPGSAEVFTVTLEVQQD